MEDLVSVPEGGVAQHCHAVHVRFDEREGIQDRAVDVGLGREVDDGVHLARQPVDQLPVADVASHEAIPRLSLELGQVLGVAGIGQLVEDRDLDLWSLLAQQTHEIGADEAGAPGDQQTFQPPRHLISGKAVQS